MRVALEGFPDRVYTPEGRLLSRRLPGAVIEDAALVAERASMMSRGKVIDASGGEIDLDVQTLCVHGDNPAAVLIARLIRERLTAEGTRLAPIAEILA